MDRTESLRVSREQFLLSLVVRGAYEAGGGVESRLVAVSLGPWSVGGEELEGIDGRRAAAGLEMIATQNLIVTLDAALERWIPDRLRHADPETRDFACFVRCLRNAFAHDPYFPTWDLRAPGYRRAYALPWNWTVDLSNRHKTAVLESDYRHAGGLVHLCDYGLKLVGQDGA